MNPVNDQMEGIVFNIQRYSIHDGPGIRTIVFLKGCPLACQWCSNPESQKLSPEMIYNSTSCIGCGACQNVCSVGAIDPSNPYWIDRKRCTSCGKCQEVCFSGALQMKGQTMTVAEVIKELKKDATIYRRSGGGITLSGGEPLVQSEFARELLMACQSLGWHTAIETTLYASAEVIDKVFPYIDLALVDVKSMDAGIHQKYTGVSNDLI